MDSTESTEIDIQNPNSKDWETSATYSALLTMENDGNTITLMNSLRRIDGTVTPDIVKEVFTRTNTTIDEWAKGTPCFTTMAALFNEDIEIIKIPDIITETLRYATIFDDRITIARQLSREDYAAVNKVIEALGGKWHKASKSHIFSNRNAEDVIANYLETGKLEKSAKDENFGYFPTPKFLGMKLVRDAGITSDSRILEPSAGIGHLAEVCAEVVPKLQITCFEIQPLNCEILTSKGFQVEQGDFLTMPPVAVYSHVVMNPPFRNQQDIDHVLHAYKFLKPGGTLVAIMSFGTMFRSNRKATNFRDFLSRHDACIEEKSPGDFKESGTMVKTISIVLKKPLRSISDDIVCDLTDHQNETFEIPEILLYPTTGSPSNQIGFDF